MPNLCQNREYLLNSRTGINSAEMLENLKKDIEKLIALYEGEKERCTKLQEELQAAKAGNDAYRKQIGDLEQKIENLRLSAAFGAVNDNAEAKARVDRLIKEIDKCISLIEK